MAEIDLKIKQSYLNWKKIKEMKIFEKSKKNKNVSFQYIKSFHNKKIKVVLFFKKGKLMSGRKYVILNEQYSLVFSTPMKELIITDPQSFFKDKGYLCYIKKVILCKEGNLDILEHWSLSAEEIFIDIDMIGRVMLSLPTKLAADRDGIPAILLQKSAT